jgi:hypothetical protein
VQDSIYQDLVALLESTQELVACAEPSLTAWQGYTIQRNQLLQRIQDKSALRADSVADSEGLQRLIASVLEQDELLLKEIRRHLSKIGHEMNEMADLRRLFKAYVLSATSPRSGHMHTA